MEVVDFYSLETFKTQLDKCPEQPTLILWFSGVGLDTLSVPSNPTNSSDSVNPISCNLLVKHYIHNY